MLLHFLGQIQVCWLNSHYCWSSMLKSGYQLHLRGCQDHNGQAMHGRMLPEACLYLGVNIVRFVHEIGSPEIEYIIGNYVGI